MLSAREWLEKGKMLEVLNHHIFYVEEKKSNSNENILLIHGFPTSSWDWHYLLPDLGNIANVYAPDMLGFGFSDKPKKNYSILEQADFLEEFLRIKQVDKFHILAHDYGDTVAQELLARDEERQKTGEIPRINSICFLNGGLFPETHKARFVQKMLLSPIGFLVTKLMGKSSFDKSFSAVFGKNTQPSKEELAIFWEIIQYNNGINNFHRLIHYMTERKIYRERWVSPLQSTATPIRLINGPEDPVSGIHMTQRYAELVKNPDIVLLSGIGHYPNTEAPKLVLEQYLPFLKQKAHS